MSKRIFRITQRAVALFIILLILFCTNVVTIADTNRTVRVAFFPMEGYHIVTSNGNFGGMDVEYMNALAQYAGWDVEFVSCVSWDDALKELSEEKVDFVGTAQYSEERAKIYDYANLASGYTYGAVIVNGSSPLAYEDFEAMKTVKFGMVKTYIRRGEFLKYMETNGVTSPQIIEYDSTAALQTALDNGEIDAAVHTFMEIKDGQRIIGRFAHAEYYYITHKNNEEVLAELDAAIADLKLNQPELENHLTNKYYNDKLGKEIVFTIDEKEYLKSRDYISVGYMNDHYPFSYIENGEYKGLARSWFDRVQEIAGIEIRYEKIDNAEEGKQKLESGEIDVLSYYTTGNDSDDTIEKSDYAAVSLVVVARSSKKSEEIEKYALTPGLKNVLETFTTIDTKSILEFEDENESVDALRNGSVDAVICNSYLASDIVNDNPEAFDLRSVLNGEEDIGIATSVAADKRLREVLEKTIDPVDNRAINEYMVQNPRDQQFTFINWITKHKFQIGCIIMLIIIAVLMIVLKMLRDSRRIQRLMYKDAELDVWNLNYFVYWTQKHLEPQSNYAVIYLNTSQFRIYGMLYGWKASNKILSSISDVLEQELNAKHEVYARNKTAAGELFARTQSDRFVLMLEYTEKNELETRLHHIIDNLENKLREITGIRITINMGVYYLDDIRENTRDAIQKANQALDCMCDKNSNISGIQYYNEELSKQIKSQHNFEEKMSKADIQKDFIVLYQAKVDIETLKVVGAEALVRYKNHKDPDDFVSPGFFIPYYESTGKVKELDFFVFETVCKMLSERIREGKEVVPVSCNFSRRHFTDRSFIEKLTGMFDKYNIPRDLIEIEITETVIMDELQQESAFAIIRELHELGIHMSIDDFGSGYSSLGVFEQIPASVLKLDRSFLINHMDRDRQAEIMKQIVKLAHNLDARVVCEGVETDDDVELMREIGAKIAQGFKYARPEPLEAFIDKLENGIKE
ncbi:MAG: EAL domain-containing protein [Oscillospiraceae bacterium]|nr:EAL domain-containing protein [Oscillospiraceae bacterium]